MMWCQSNENDESFSKYLSITEFFTLALGPTDLYLYK